jgi:hypothetical protein
MALPPEYAVLSRARDNQKLVDTLRPHRSAENLFYYFVDGITLKSCASLAEVNSQFAFLPDAQ